MPEYEAASQVLRVVVADDRYLVREAIAYLLDSDPGLEVVASCEDEDGLDEALRTQHADIVVVNVRMAFSGDALAQAGVGLVLVSDDASGRSGLAWPPDERARRALLLSGRVRERDYLVRAVRTVAAGGSFVDPAIAEAHSDH
jgi:DNA-binding NarL/FixJ family response regulator